MKPQAPAKLIQTLIPLLQVFDMRRSLAFYVELLGGEVVSTSQPEDDFDWAMLKLEPAYIMLNKAYESHERPEQPDDARDKAHSDTILYFLCEDPDAVYAYLTDHNWPAEPPVDREYGMRQVYTADPDGYEVCFQCEIPTA